MKKYLHKIPLLGLTMLCATSCEGNHSPFNDENAKDIDTVLVLGQRQRSWGSARQIWCCGKSGDRYFGLPFYVSDTTVYPNTGDTIVIVPDGGNIVNVIDNLTQKKRMEQFIKQK